MAPVPRPARFPFLLMVLSTLLALTGIWAWLRAASASLARAGERSSDLASPSADAIVTISRTDTVYPLESFRTSVACTGTWQVVGGGFKVQGPDYDTAWMASYPQDAHTWQVYLQNQESHAIYVNSYANCVPGVTGYQIISATAGAGPSQTLDFMATCPGNKTVLGGGFQQLDDKPETLWRGSWPSADSVWRIHARNVRTNTVSLRAHAICGNTLRPHEIVQSALTGIQAQLRAALNAACPASEYALGGGFYNVTNTFEMQWRSSFPSSRQGWQVDVLNASNQTQYPQAWVVCSELPLSSIDIFLPAIQK